MSWVRVPPAQLLLARKQRRSSVVEHRKNLWSKLRRLRFFLTNTVHHYFISRTTPRNTLGCRFGVHGKRPQGSAGSSPAPSASIEYGRDL